MYYYGHTLSDYAIRGLYGLSRRHLEKGIIAWKDVTHLILRSSYFAFNETMVPISKAFTSSPH